MSQLKWILYKDLLIEWRGRARVAALSTFAITLLLLFSFAVGPDTEALRTHASAYLWLSVLTASTLLLTHGFKLEVESGAMEGLLLLPVSPRAIFYGKAIANMVLLLGVGLVALLVTLLIFDVSPRESGLWLVLILVLGTAGVSAPGTLYAGLTARLHAAQMVLPVLLFPLVVPCMVAAVRATSLVLAGDAMDQLGSWLWVLGCFDAIYWSLCGLLFHKVIG